MSKINNKIYNHPDRDIIMRMISEKKGDREIAKFLAEKYPQPHHAHLRANHKTIYNFRQEFMPNGRLSKIAIAEASVPKWAVKNREVATELAKNSAYQEAIAKIAEEELNSKRELIQMMTILKSRIEVYYNSLTASNKLDEKHEKVLLEQMKLLLSILQQQDKATLAASGGADINVNINIVKDHAQVIREAIRETLSDVDPNLSIEFMERVNMKMRDLEMSEETGIVPFRPTV